MREEYALIDSGFGSKLERFGSYTLARPSAQAVWKPKLPQKAWQCADGVFSRDPENRWSVRQLPDAWEVWVGGIRFRVAPTDFGHVGVFPEQADHWEWIRRQVSRRQCVEVLNLFAYSGGATLAAAQGGAAVCHLDASKGMVAWARDHAAINGLDNAPIRWIVDDVTKFLKREQRRGKRYDGIILDPPSFGRGSRGEVFKIEEDIHTLLDLCRSVLSPQPLCVLFSCHTPGFTPIALEHLVAQMMEGFGGVVEVGEMLLTGEQGVFSLPSGTYARWSHG